ncbi:MAG TPA: hypothetical protein VFS18_04915 [Actinomycetota bacterium]|nr:hypothetical protein [Actinomycetota bacterium]
MGGHPDDLRNRVYCSSCGISATKRRGLAPLGWQEMPDANGRQLALCPDCVRQNLWLIEARLDLDPGAGF